MGNIQAFSEKLAEIKARREAKSVDVTPRIKVSEGAGRFFVLSKWSEEKVEEFRNSTYTLIPALDDKENRVYIRATDNFIECMASETFAPKIDFGKPFSWEMEGSDIETRYRFHQVA